MAHRHEVWADPMATSGKRRTGAIEDNRWHGRPVLSGLVSTSVFVVPIAVSILAATATAHLLPRPRTTGYLTVWWLTVLIVPSHHPDADQSAGPSSLAPRRPPRR